MGSSRTTSAGAGPEKEEGRGTGETKGAAARAVGDWSTCLMERGM
jgi:hypothetical protein